MIRMLGGVNEATKVAGGVDGNGAPMCEVLTALWFRSSCRPLEA